MATFLVFGATGGTGKHFVTRALESSSNSVRALVRNPEKLGISAPNLEIIPGSISDDIDTNKLLANVDYVVVMLGDREAQRKTKIITPFIKKLVPSMRKHGVSRLLYQAGGFSRPYGESLSPILWTLRYTIAREFEGQHQDNEAVMEYLATEASDIEWIVHRAGIGGDGPSKGTLQRSRNVPSIASHRDCAEYSFRLVRDDSAVRTVEFSRYQSSA